MSDDVTTPAPTSIAIGDSSLIASLGLKEEFRVDGDGGTYVIFSRDGESLFETDTYRLVYVLLPSGQVALAKVSTSADHNFALMDEIETIARLQAVASKVDTEFESRKETGPHYGSWFPMPLEPFMTEDGRAGAFLAYHQSILSYKQLEPASLIIDRARIDIQTSIWLAGKQFKFLDFMHVQGRALGYLDSTNVFIEKDMHGVFFLSFAEVAPATEASCKADVQAAMRVVWQLLGASETTDPPHDADITSAEKHAAIVALYRKIMAGEMTAEESRAALYKLADETWERVPIAEGPNAGNLQRPHHKWIEYSKELVKAEERRDD